MKPLTNRDGEVRKLTARDFAIFLTVFLLIHSFSAFALYVRSVTVSPLYPGLYAIKIHSPVPADNYLVNGIPADQPRLLERINQVIAEASNDPNAYVAFGNAAGTHFFDGSCHIPLPNPKAIKVTIDLTHRT